MSAPAAAIAKRGSKTSSCMLQAQIEEHHLMHCIASVQVARQLCEVGAHNGFLHGENIPSCLCCGEDVGSTCTQMQAVLCPNS